MFSNLYFDIANISKKKHLSFTKRLSLIIFYLKLKIIHKFSKVSDKPGRVNFLGFNAEYESFNDFFSTFYELFVIEEYLNSDISLVDVVIDAGANIGLATMYFKWLNPNIKIIAFEMDSDTFVHFSNNVKSSHLENVTCHKFALGRQDSEVTAHGSNRATTINMELANSMDAKANPERKQKVSVRKLSDFIPDAGNVMLKMDIEGAEIDVLKELQEADKLSCFKQVVFEFHYVDSKKYVEVESLFKTSGFVVEKGKVQKNGYFIVNAKR